MSGAQLGSAAAAEGLRRFLIRSAELRHQGSSGTSGLLRFFERAGPLLQAPRAVVAVASVQPARSSLDPARLQHVISTLTGPLRQAPPLRASLNVWSVAGLKRDELRNAAVLAWFLKPHGSHGFGSAVMRALLDEVARIAPDWPYLGRDFSRVSVLTEEWPLGSETDRVDIAIDGPDFALFIEVKIDAPEGPNQLARYAVLAQQKARALGRKYGRVIYLGPRAPRDPPPDVAIITWREVARVLSALPREGIGGALAAQFARHVRAFF
ncbi:PD-(D/E)XK nuclease family protein [Roseomonas chloroacetimidivorans]|uniref:PD-(D/E)XK nuclease family protein n=1 Tax=Roseomonas chloroacetimidivorans TaxID=1766656 RepID=UPI003C725904